MKNDKLVSKVSLKYRILNIINEWNWYRLIGCSVFNTIKYCIIYIINPFYTNDDIVQKSKKHGIIYCPYILADITNKNITNE